MKKSLKLGVLAALLLICVASAGTLYARITDRSGDIVVTPQDSVDNVAARVTLPNQSATSTAVLVDISDTTNFKHAASSGSVDISSIQLEWNTLGTATTTTEVKVCLLASTTPSGSLSDLYCFAGAYFEYAFQNSTGVNPGGPRSQRATIDFSPAVLKTRVSSGAPANFVTNDKLISSFLVATTTAYTSPRGSATVNPAAGDVILLTYSQTGNATTTATALYRVTE